MSRTDEARERGREAAQAVLAAINWYIRRGRGDPEKVKHNHRCRYRQPELVKAFEEGYDEMVAEDAARRP